MLGRITFIGKKLITKSSDESIPSSKKLNAIHLKGSANLSRSNMLYQDFGHAASMMNTESYTKLLSIRSI
jgi:hypothetical protein